jgi:hypothetical protein
MTKIYLIKHLDSGMKYVGITDGDLAKRWQQHYNDPNSAVYSALRSEGYRMTMELLDDVPSREEALRKEQEYIRTLGTAQPHGWNRMVSKVEVVKPVVKKWVDARIVFIDGVVRCPSCGGSYTHHRYITIRPTMDYREEIQITRINITIDDAKGDYYIHFYCEDCSLGQRNEDGEILFGWYLHIDNHKGNTIFQMHYEIEEATQ